MPPVPAPTMATRLDGSGSGEESLSAGTTRVLEPDLLRADLDLGAGCRAGHSALKAEARGLRTADIFAQGCEGVKQGTPVEWPLSSRWESARKALSHALPEVYESLSDELAEDLRRFDIHL